MACGWQAFHKLAYSLKLSLCGWFVLYFRRNLPQSDSQLQIGIRDVVFFLSLFAKSKQLDEEFVHISKGSTMI